MARFPLTNGRNIEERSVVLGNRRSIHLSYGATGGFPSFSRVSGQPSTRKSRQKGRNDMARKVAHGVPDLDTALMALDRLARKYVAAVDALSYADSEGFEWPIDPQEGIALAFADPTAVPEYEAILRSLMVSREVPDASLSSGGFYCAGVDPAPAPASNDASGTTAARLTPPPTKGTPHDPE